MRILSPSSWSIRVKIIAIVALALLGSVSALTAFNYLTLSSASEQDAGELLMGYSQAAVRQSAETLAGSIKALRTLALSLALVDAARTASRAYQGRTPEEITAAITPLDEAWQAEDAGVETLVADILNNSTSERLTEFRNSFPEELEVFLTDVQGANIAMTERTGDYLQADEDWWQRTFDRGLGKLHVA